MFPIDQIIHGILCRLRFTTDDQLTSMEVVLLCDYLLPYYNMLVGAVYKMTHYTHALLILITILTLATLLAQCASL